MNFAAEVKDAQNFDVVEVSPDYYAGHYWEFLPRYISMGNPSLDTLNTYKNAIDQFIKWCVGKKRHPLAINEYQLRIYMEYLYEANYKDDTIGNKMAAIKAFFMVARKMGFVKVSPADDMKM